MSVKTAAKLGYIGSKMQWNLVKYFKHHNSKHKAEIQVKINHSSMASPQSRYQVTPKL